jgi:hypothetical protein
MFLVCSDVCVGLKGLKAELYLEGRGFRACTHFLTPLKYLEGRDVCFTLKFSYK